MPDIVGIRFKRAGKVYYFDPTKIDLKVNDNVVVQTARGVEVGQVVIAPKQVLESDLTVELKPILRQATDEDIKRAREFASREKNSLVECGKTVSRLKLPMKLVSAEYNLDGGRLTFYFTAEERVDFRELVRELTSFFKTRIELRQIGPRDQAKLVGGMGRCGRPLCCVSFLSEFDPVSIKMAKEQDLPLDPMKISGVCGRLLCCLGYENAQYREAKEKMPRKGQPVDTPSGPGQVVGGNPLKETVLVELESQATVEIPLAQITLRKDLPRPVAAAEPSRAEPAQRTGAARTPAAAPSPAAATTQQSRAEPAQQTGAVKPLQIAPGQPQPSAPQPPPTEEVKPEQNLSVRKTIASTTDQSREEQGEGKDQPPPAA
jgi:cell fate regulator YaaT (PSP1 superfamily)